MMVGEFVSWDDEIPNIYIWKNHPFMFQTSDNKNMSKQKHNNGVQQNAG